MQQLMSKLEITEVPESWERNYDKAMACMPKSSIPFLQESYLAEVRKYIELSEVRAEHLKEAFKLIQQDEDFSRLAWLWHYMIYMKPDSFDERVAIWPRPNPSEPALSKAADFFPAVVLLSGFPKIREQYQERNIPEQIMRDTLGKVQTCMKIYEEESGKMGMSMRFLNWLLNHFQGKLFSLGRLEFEMRHFRYPIRVYQNVHDGRVIALSEDGVAYRGDGLVDGTNGVNDEISGWVATLQENGDQIEGYPLSPDDGAALKDMLSISKQEWALKLAQGDPVLHVHIPREGSFTAEDCYESFGRARDFFAKYYPDWPYTAVACVSWLMDPQLRELLSESSNLVKFQAWYRPFPVKSGDESIYTFVFRSEKREIEQLPETTSLHKKMKTFMKEGGRFRLGGGFILPDDLEADKLSRKLQELE